tara:strand:+ start:503 stop:940 length:438 start_codon:yes stop_codon:yes gene_type:complete
MEPLLVYYSSTSGNTDRFVRQLGMDNIRIPVSLKASMEPINRPFILVCPTYADNDGSKAVPKQVIHFLNNAENRNWMQGVIGSGNRNFGHLFARAANIISKKCGVPLLYKFELSGTPDDITNVREGVQKLWHSLKKPTETKRTGT